MTASDWVTPVADVAIALLWGAVAAYFLNRYIHHRRLVSLALAVMAVGWLIVGNAERLFALPGAAVVFRAVSLFCGVFLWYAIWRVENEKSGASK